jgi:hypothetical protein
MLGHMQVLVESGIVPEPLHSRMAELEGRMRTAMAVLCHPDGKVALFNDSAIGDGPSPDALRVLSGGSCAGIQVLSEAGYAGLRAGPFTAIFDAGPCGPDDNPGHAHADFLSFECSFSGERLIVDPGVATYKGGPQRNLTRSSLSHNGPAFASLEPIEFLGPFRVGRRGRANLLNLSPLLRVPSYAAVAGWHNGYMRFSGLVARWLGISEEGCLTSIDVWKGRPDLEARSRFLIPSCWTVMECSHSMLRVVAEGTRAEVTLSTPDGELRLDEVPQTCFPFGPRIPMGCHGVALIPQRQGDERSVTFTISASRATAPAAELGTVAPALLTILRAKAR